MKRKEQKNLAQKIAKYEFIVQTSNNKDEIRKAQDNIKNEWCKKQGITLIRIPYTHLEKISIEDLLENSQFKRA